MGEAAVSSGELVPDRAQAERYIAALAGSPDAEVTFQTFDDRADGQAKDPALNRVRHGTLATYWGELVNLNRRGAGVYVMVNEGDGKGRGAANVTALRAVFLDDDQGDLAPAALLLTPSIVVRSKAGLHVYWRLRPGEPLDSFTSTQEELADQYGTDASVKDLPRVLRLPGFLHLKDRADPFPVRVVSTSPAVYSIDDVLPARRAEPVSKSHAATLIAPPRVRAVRAAGSFGQAVAAFNAANPWPDLPAHNRPGPCPICGDSKSFHEHPAGSGKWSCLSSDHPATVGRPKAACYVGDALNLWAHARGLTRLEVLVAEGYWGKVPERPAPPAPAPQAPAAVLSPRPCDVARLRERERVQFVPVADLPEGHGLGEPFDATTGGGLAPGALVGVGAAGTGAGKTALVMQALDGLALRSAIAAEDPEATVPLTPIAIFSEMAAEDLEVRTLGRLLDVPGAVLAAGRSARRWHKWAWVEDQFNRAAALMQPGGTYHRIAAWQRFERAGKLSGSSLVRAAEEAVSAWVEEIAARYPTREIVPILAFDPINSFLSSDGRSEVETLGEMAGLLDELADRRRWICIFTAETNKTSAAAAGAGNTGGSAAAIYRGTMQLLHRCDLALVLEAGDPDPDGVRPVSLTFDKNRTGRTGTSTAYRWHTRTGLRFVAETEEEHAGREVTDTTFASAGRLMALCAVVERLQTSGETVTERMLRSFKEEIGIAERSLPRLILAAIEGGILRRLADETGRGGGKGRLVAVEGWQEKTTPKTEPVQTGAKW